jgi:hypothetical protein
MLSIGLEKLYKLTLGVAALDANQKWLTAKEMQDRKHYLFAMHEEVMVDLTARAAKSTPFVRELIQDVRTDPVVRPLVTVLQRYALSGRFYSLSVNLG